MKRPVIKRHQYNDAPWVYRLACTMAVLFSPAIILVDIICAWIFDESVKDIIATDFVIVESAIEYIWGKYEE